MYGSLVVDRGRWQEVSQEILDSSEAAIRFYYSKSQDLIGYSVAWGPPGEVKAVYIPLQHAFGANVQVTLEELIHFFQKAPLIAVDIRGEWPRLRRLLGCAANFVGDPVLMSVSTLGLPHDSFQMLAQVMIGAGTSEIEALLNQFDRQFQETSSEDSTLLQRATGDARVLLDLHREMSRRYQEEEDDYSTDLHLTRIAWEVSEEGYRVDWPEVHLRRQVLERDIETSKGKIQGHLGEVNPEAHGQMVRALYSQPSEGGLGLPCLETTATGRPSVSRSALEALKNHHPVIDRLLHHKDLLRQDRALAGLEDGRRGDRVYTHWYLKDRHFLCSKPNLLNQKREVFTHFLADPGTRWVGMGYPGASFKLLASAFGTGPLMEIALSGVKDPFQALADRCGLSKAQMMSLLAQACQQARDSDPVFRESCLRRLAPLIQVGIGLPLETGHVWDRAVHGAAWLHRDTLLAVDAAMERDQGDSWLSGLRSFLPLQGGLYFEAPIHVSLEEIRDHFHEPAILDLDHGLKLVLEWVEGPTVGACMGPLQV